MTRSNVLKTSILRLAGTSSVLIFCSLVLPRLLPNDSGMASAASAALLFGVLFLIAVALAIWAGAKTVANFSHIDLQTRVIGTIPSALLVCVGLWLYLQL